MPDKWEFVGKGRVPVGVGWRPERGQASAFLQQNLGKWEEEAGWVGRGQIENGLTAVGFLLKAMGATREY